MFFKRIRTLRENSKLTQNQLAEYLKIPLDTYLQYENGAIEVTPDVVAKLALFYKTSADYLLDLTDEKAPYPPPRFPVNIE